MEDVLEVYQRPHDPAFPVVCVDETSKQLIAETRVPIAAKPGHPARHDYEYERNSLPPRMRYVMHTCHVGYASSPKKPLARRGAGTIRCVLATGEQEP